MSATDCSDGISPVGVVTDEEREAYEEARFLTPEGSAAAKQELVRSTGQALPSSSTPPDVNDVLRRPNNWPVLAQGKLYEYTGLLPPYMLGRLLSWRDSRAGCG